MAGYLSPMITSSAYLCPIFLPCIFISLIYSTCCAVPLTHTRCMSKRPQCGAEMMLSIRADTVALTSTLQSTRQLHGHRTAEQQSLEHDPPPSLALIQAHPKLVQHRNPRLNRRRCYTAQLCEELSRDSELRSAWPRTIRRPQAPRFKTSPSRGTLPNPYRPTRPSQHPPTRTRHPAIRSCRGKSATPCSPGSGRSSRKTRSCWP